MADDWTETTLGIEVNLLTGYPFKSALYTNEPTGVRLLRGDNIAQGGLRWDGVKKWPLDEKGAFADYQLRDGDVVIAMDRPWIEAGLKYSSVSSYDLPCLLVQRVARLRGGRRLDSGYLRYIIGGRDFTQYVRGVETGTAVPHISANQIKDFPITLPPLAEQKAIAHILGTLDDKIELKRRMNETLEAIARAIFKSWFVDFDPVRAKADGRSPTGMDAATAALFPDSFQDSPLGKIPSQWKVDKLQAIADVIMGTSPPGDTYNEAAIGTALVNGPVEFGEYFAVAKKWTTQPVRMSEPGDLIFCVRGSTTGRYVIADRAYCLGRGVCAIRSRRQANAFVYSFIHAYLDQLLAKTSGSVFPSLNAPDIKQFETVCPPLTLVVAYEQFVKPMLHQVWSNVKESETLAALRDALLPKLLSGEIRVSEAERVLHELPASTTDDGVPPPKHPAVARITRPSSTAGTTAAVTERTTSTSTRQDIDEFETDEVMAAFRQVLRGKGRMKRDELLKEVSLHLDFAHLGPRIRETLKGHLRAAIRRRIVGTDGPDTVFADTSTMADYSRDELVQFLASVSRKGTNYTRDELVQNLAHHLGFSRVTENIRDPIKSAINGAIRRGILAYEGEFVWREY